MNLVPILVVDPTEYGPPGRSATALLDLACVGGQVRDVWSRWLQAISSLEPLEVTTAAVSASEATAARTESTPSGVRGTLADLVSDPLRVLDPFDVALFVNVRLLPLDPSGLVELRNAVDQNDHGIVHLLAEGDPAAGHAEVVYAPTNGEIHRIQRYLEHPGRGRGVAMRVMASRVPVRRLLSVGATETIQSLDDLRAALVVRGHPSVDRTSTEPYFDLATEEGALSFVQERVRAHHETHGSVATARRRGMVVVEPGAQVAPDALLVGPTYVAAGARIGAGARIAQSVILDGADVPPGATVRHCMLSATPATAGLPLRRRRPIMTPRGAPVTPRQTLYLRLRPIVESMIAALSLAILSPLLLVIAGLVRLSSRGPVLYRDKREGRGAQPFACLKFRTMRLNADALQRQLKTEQYADGPHFKMVNDPRLTPIGGVLRRFNLDELPQIINVLRGEMSFVGPRPSPLRENQICAPWRRARLSVTPGITGLWQVCRHNRTAGDFHQWIEFDLLYVEHVSFAVDLRILWATLRTRGGQQPVPVASIIPRHAAAQHRASDYLVQSTLESVSDDHAYASGAGEDASGEPTDRRTSAPRHLLGSTL